MLAALDAMIENGAGGRPVIALRQVCRLYLRIGFEGEDDTSALFDELMATLAMELDEPCVAVLAPELKRMPGVLPGFTSTVMSRFHEIALRPAPGQASRAAPAAREPSAPESPPIERRAAAREPVADAADPLALARRATPAQLVEIARLPALPEMLTSVIASRGHPPAVAAALANPGAVFSRSSFIMLAELAAGDRALRAGLLARPDLPDAAVDRLLPVVGREARARLILSGPMPTAADARAALAAAEAEFTRKARGGDSAVAVDMMLRAAGEGADSLDRCVGALCRDGRLAELAAFAAARLETGFVTAYAMLTVRLDHAAAILMRALGASRDAADLVLDLRRRRGWPEARDASGAHFAYAMQEDEEARVLVALADRAVAADEAAAEPAPATTFGLALVG